MQELSEYTPALVQWIKVFRRAPPCEHMTTITQSSSRLLDLSPLF